jgi:histidinol-phosphate aminotransferase
VIIVVDEAYYEYVVAPDYPQTLQLQKDHPNLVVLRSFSKIHSLAGLRIGYGIGHRDLIGELHKTREPFNVNSLAQAAALACLEHWQEVAARAARNRERMEWLSEQLTRLGLQVTPSQTNFLFVRCDGHAGQLAQQLLSKGVIVRPMTAWGFNENALRISVGLPHENEHCIAALREILGEA